VKHLLKPCPFCGAEAHIHQDTSPHRSVDDWRVWCIGCTNFSCAIWGPWAATLEEAIQRWNARIVPTPDLNLPPDWPINVPLPTQEEAEAAVRHIGEDMKAAEKERKRAQRRAPFDRGDRMSDDDTDYAYLRDVIIRELDPPDDDSAETAILENAIIAVVQERDIAIQRGALLRTALRNLADVAGPKPQCSNRVWNEIAQQMLIALAVTETQ
jgi:hypothetical protein